MKKVCLNCEFCDVANSDKEYDSIFDMVAEDDYLICTHTFNIMSARNINQDSGHNLKVQAFIVDEDNTCKLWKKSLERESDLKCGC